MTITKELVDTMLRNSPGGSIAYQGGENGMKLLGYSADSLEVSGYTREELDHIIERDPFSMIYEDDKEFVQEVMAKGLYEGEKVSCCFRVLGCSGKILWVMCRGKRIGELDGFPVLLATLQNSAAAENQIDLVNSIPTGLGIFKYSDHVSQIFLNDGFYEMMQMDRKYGTEFLGDNALNAVHPEDREWLVEKLKSTEAAPFLQFPLRIFKGDDGTYLWIQVTAKLFEVRDGACVYYTSFSNIDELKNMSEELQQSKVQQQALLDQLIYAAEHDELTGLYNRKKAYAESEKLLAAHPDETFAIVHFDIQRFRLYNSFFGEEEGDKLLCYIADMFRSLSHTHKYGVYGRIEADVFFLCFPLTKDVIEWNEKYIHQRLMSYRSDFMLAGASGVYVAHNSKLSVEAMFNRAMEAGKTCQNKQLNRVAVYSEQMEQQMLSEHRIAAEMRNAIENKEFVVYLQPKYTTRDAQPYGAEALVRWIHPKYGRIMPNEFIPLFEKNGFITTLDRYMWESVCQLIRRWLDEGKKVSPISVNVSRVSMYSPETVPFLRNLIKQYQIPAELLNLELTESAYMDDPDDIRIRLEELQNSGFEIMMDDFGSGFSSLNTLREMSFNYLKVDRMLLVSVEKDVRTKAVLTAIIRMANSINIPVIAEGVETEEQHNFLKEIGCDYIQGFLFARPMPVEDYEKMIFEAEE